MGQHSAFIFRLLQIAGGKGNIAVLEAYLDESERTGGVFCIAGYLFVPRQARRFVKEWTDLFGQQGAHMKDLCAQKRQFKNTSRKECDRLLREAIKIIKCRMELGVAVSCDVNVVDKSAPKFVVGFGHAYPVLCHMAMQMFGTWAQENRPGERVVYTFEAGHEFEGEANRFVASAIHTPAVKEAYQYGGHSFLPKSDAVPLQSADLLAWEWTKFKDETHDRGIRPIRLSLAKLMDGNLHKYKTAHIRNEGMKRYLDFVRWQVLLQIKEERDAREREVKVDERAI